MSAVIRRRLPAPPTNQSGNRSRSRDMRTTSGVDIILHFVPAKSQPERGRLEAVQHPMKVYARRHDGVLIGRSQGERARHDLERAMRDQPSGAPIALDFRGVRAVTVPFADALL